MVFQDVPAMFSSQKGPHRSQIVSKILEKKPPLTGAALPPGPVSSWDVLKWQTSIELLQKPPRQPFVPQHSFNGIIYFVVVLLPTETGFKYYKNDHWLKCGSLSSSLLWCAPKFRRIALWHFQTSCLSSRREVIKSLVWGEGWDHFKNGSSGFQIRSVLRIRVAQIC